MSGAREAIPRTFKLRGKIWTVSYVDDLLTEHKAHGMCHHDLKSIVLGGHLKGDALYETFLHEILHASGPASSKKWTDAQEEAWVSTVSPNLVKVLRGQGWLK